MVGECINCGYDLRGTGSAICPECGHAIPASAETDTCVLRAIRMLGRARRGLVIGTVALYGVAPLTTLSSGLGIVMLFVACLLEAVCLIVSVTVLVLTRQGSPVGRRYHDATQETKLAFRQAKFRMQRLVVIVLVVLAALFVRLICAIRAAETVFNA